MRFTQQSLLLRFSPAQRIESNVALVKIHLGSNEAVNPVLLHIENTAKHVRLPTVVSAPEKYDLALRPELYVEYPAFRYRTAQGRCLLPEPRLAPCSGGVAPGALTERFQ